MFSLNLNKQGRAAAILVTVLALKAVGSDVLHGSLRRAGSQLHLVATGDQLLSLLLIGGNGTESPKLPRQARWQGRPQKVVGY